MQPAASPLPRYAPWVLLRCWLPTLSIAAIIVATAHDLAIPVHGPALGLACAGTWTIYSIDRIGDQPAGAATRWILYGAACLGAVAGAWLIGQIPRTAQIIIMGVGLLGMLHRWLRYLLPKNLVVAGAWTATLCAVLGPAATTPLVCAALMLLIWSACLLCDEKDHHADHCDRTITISRFIGQKGRRWTALVGAVTSSALAASLCMPLLAWTAVLLVPLALRPAWIAGPILGSIIVDGMLAIPGLVVLLRPGG